jgi:antitoxin FitA
MSSTLTIRKLDDRVKQRLRVRAARNGRSMEEEARRILKSALGAKPSAKPEGLGTMIRKIFAPLGGVDLPELPRQYVKDPHLFDDHS